MMYNAEIGVGCTSSTQNCQTGSCPSPDLCIKKGDTRPSLRVSVNDCDGVVDLSDDNLALEASMWFAAKTKSIVSPSETTLQFADNVGFETVQIGDVIVTKRGRNPEIMLVSSINESSKTITVQRGYDGSDAQEWPRGTELKVFRFRSQAGVIESVFEDVTSVDGTTKNELVDTFLVFNWEEGHTTLPGCYLLEFKLFMVNPDTAEIEWTKSIPLSKEGYAINVLDSSVM